MAKGVWQATIVNDDTGLPVPLASVRFEDQLGNLVSLYSDPDGTPSPGNPKTADEYGFLRVYADVATRLNITASLGDFTKTWEDVVLVSTDTFPSTNDDITVTVGSGGDFANINSALEDLTLKYATYVRGGFNARIRLLTGFAMAEQVLVKGIDLSWITIISDDAEVTITRSALTTTFSAEGGDTFPAFGADNGALPIIGTVFNMNSTGTATDRHGIYAVNGSYARVLENCGIKNAGGHGAFINRASRAELHLGVFSGATQNGLYVARQSNVDAGSIDVSNAGANGIEAVRASYVDAANGLNASSVGGDAVTARDGSVVNCNGGNLSDAGDDGVVCATGATVICTLADVTNAAGIGINCVGAGSAVAAEQVDVSGAGEYGVFAANAAYVNVISGTGTGCALNAIRASQGSIVNAYGFNGSGALGSAGIVAEGGATINIATGNCQQGGSPAATDSVITNGGFIITAGMTGGSSSPGVLQAAGYFLDSSNRKVIGNRSAVASALGTAQDQVVGAGTAVAMRLNAVFSNDTAGPFLALAKSRNATIGAHTIVQSGDVLGGITGEGSDGTSFVRAAMMRFEVDGTPGATNDMPGRIGFFTTPDGSGTLSERFRLTNAGRPHFISHNTTASAANAFLDSGSSPVGELLRSTSSERYKRSIEDLQDKYADAILNLRPVWYRSNIERDRQDWSWYGLLAEEVAKIDPRLVHWGYRKEDIVPIECWDYLYDDEGKPVSDENGEHQRVCSLRFEPKKDAELVPDGVQYDRLAVMLLNHIQRLRKEVDELKLKVK